MTCPETMSIGAYVLGALEPSERRATEEHVATCPTCRETLLQFAHLPGLLHAVPVEDIETDQPEPAPLQLTKKRPRRRWVLAAASAVVVSGLVSWGLVTAPASATWTATDGVGGIDTTAKLTSHGWGTDIQLRLTDLQPDKHCMLIVHGRDGSTETAGWWASNGTYQARVPASTSIPLEDITSLQVVTSADAVLSTITPATK
ncbi:anti-sigma factor family protein [Kribbella kalugense]|uniref:Putative zinc finger protein n=1 Tax=Kribbella kalugense TaxID=2512221 RepID=A0A4R8A0K0_9ACTN|nr:zf-HC2 domain-containing protein [Kribbella kalugense]TDW24013.1 putative zinc finger protein [Kribbella kalugense]